MIPPLWWILPDASFHLGVGRGWREGWGGGGRRKGKSKPICYGCFMTGRSITYYPNDLVDAYCCLSDSDMSVSCQWHTPSFWLEGGEERVGVGAGEDYRSPRVVPGVNPLTMRTKRSYKAALMSCKATPATSVGGLIQRRSALNFQSIESFQIQFHLGSPHLAIINSQRNRWLIHSVISNQTSISDQNNQSLTQILWVIRARNHCIDIVSCWSTIVSFISESTCLQERTRIDAAIKIMANQCWKLSINQGANTLGWSNHQRGLIPLKWVQSHQRLGERGGQRPN